jgi:hypothetical protein
MSMKKATKSKPTTKVVYEVQENPVSIFRPLTNIPIIVGNLEKKDPYKTEPFLSSKQQ